MGKNNKMAKEPRRNLESALERLRREDRLRRSTKGSPLYNIAQTLTELDTEEEKVPQTISLEAALKSTYMVPTSIAFGLLHGLGKIGGNFASFVGALDQEYVDTLSKSVSGKFLKFASEQAPEKDAGGRRLMETIGKLGTAGGEMVSYAVPAIGFARIFQVALGFRPLVATAAADALVGFGGMSPDEENFFNFVEDISKENNLEALETLGRILATNPNNTEFENRVNNGIETLIALGLSESAVRGIIKLNTMRKMAFAKAKGEDTANKYEAVKEKLSPEINKELDKAVEPKPTDEEPLGTPVTEAEKLPVDKQTELALKASDIEENLLKSIQENKPPEIQDKSNVPESIIKAVDSVFAKELGELDKPKKPQHYPLISYEEFLEKYKPSKGIKEEFDKKAKEMEDPFDDELSAFAKKLGEPDPKFKEEFDKTAKEMEEKSEFEKETEAKEVEPVKEATPTTIQFEEFEKVGPKPGGSSDGAKIKDKATGIEYIAKFYEDPEQAIQEVITFKAYQLAGIKTPDARVVNAKIDGEERVFLLSEFMPNLSPYDPKGIDPEDAGRLHVAAALMKDWDVIGLTKDNIAFGKLQGTGEPQLVQVDAGGSGVWKATGGKKNKESKNIFDIPSNAIEDWSSIVSGMNKQADEVFRSAYQDNPTAYMKGVDKALTRILSNFNQLRLTAVEAAMSVPASKITSEGPEFTTEYPTEITNTYAPRIFNLIENLKDPIDLHNAIDLGFISKGSEIENELVAFSPVGNEVKTLDKNTQTAISKYRNTPEYKAQKLGFDPEAGINRFSSSDLTLKPTSLVQATTLTPSEFYKYKPKALEDEDPLLAQGEDFKNLKYEGVIPKDIDVVKEKKEMGIGVEKSDAELAGDFNITVGTTNLASYTRKQAKKLSDTLKEKGIDKVVKFMLDPHGGKKWKLTGTGKKFGSKVDGKFYEQAVGKIYGGPLYNNAFVFADGIHSEEFLINAKKILFSGTQLAATDVSLPTGAVPIQFLTLGKSIDFHVPNVLEQITLPQNPNSKELIDTWLKIRMSIKSPYTYAGAEGSIKVVEGYADLIFTNAYGATAFKLVKGAEEVTKSLPKDVGTLGKADIIFNNLSAYEFADGLQKTTRFKKFDYAPNTPQGKKEYQKEFGGDWTKEAVFDDTRLQGWSAVEASGGKIIKFLDQINTGAETHNDVFLTVAVNDEIKQPFNYSSATNDTIIRTPNSQATLPPALAKMVITKSSNQVKKALFYDKRTKYASTLKAITYDPKNPSKIDKTLSAKMGSNVDTNVFASYTGGAALLTLSQFIPEKTKEEIEVDSEFIPLDQGESIREELPQTELDTTPITREATEKSTSSTLEDGTVVLHPTIYKDKKTNIPQELSGQDALIAAMDFEARNPNLEFPRFDTVEEADQYSRDRSEAGGASEMPLYLDTTEEELDIDSQMSDLNLGEQSNDELRQTL